MTTPHLRYWTSVASPWAWLGSARFNALARAHHVAVELLPVELTEVFHATGGLTYGERPPARRSYRQLELARWSRRLGVPINLEPRYYPVAREPASRLLIAVRQCGQDPLGHHALGLLHAILQAVWVQDRDIADWATLVQLCEEAGLPAAGLDVAALVSAAQQEAVAAQFARDTRAAVEHDVFGVPMWVLEGERFWGQDRLDFLEERLAGLPAVSSQG